MEAFLHQLAAGLAAGGVYASMALALVMIYQATHHINFAQGEMATFSAFIAWALLQAGVPYWLAFAATVLVSFAMGAAVQFVIVRPLEKAPELSVVVVFIGLLVVFHSMAGWLFGFDVKRFPSPFPAEAWFGSALLSVHQLGAMAVTLALVAMLFAFLRLTSLGLAMRAAAENADSARLLGVPVSRMLMLGWGLAGAIGAVAGMMVAPTLFLDPHMMSGVLLYAFAGALVGGINNPVGAVVGGLVVGVAENLLGTYVIGTELKLPLALVLIVTVLVFRPAGLLGRVVVKRV
ncbi:branched-chain amino acid transport system permease protein [Variovorax paradoxus]|uniref:Branched-chain amino acid transport system permease protein n=1 Tax=Variovorax paradoxus TaxID=34073 RepID=A0AAW8ESL1_VARPD|nr:branched-chain amino acid ABC transporter permease [Variovorax paradoxus]MDP9974811.1 branched-chain amino acid transport system permease protein [Variovorax paradoxus]